MPTALVTGASRGIGAHVARMLAPTHDLILAGRDTARLEAVAAELGGARTLAVDLTDSDSLIAAVDGIAELGALVHCAGIASSLQPIAETTTGEWRRLMDVNVIAAADLTRALLPALRAGSGHVVFLNSGAGQNVRAGWTPYAASKFALRALADGLRAEEPDLRVTSIYPGRVDTDMQRDIVATRPGSSGRRPSRSPSRRRSPPPPMPTPPTSPSVPAADTRMRTGTPAQATSAAGACPRNSRMAWRRRW